MACSEVTARRDTRRECVGPRRHTVGDLPGKLRQDPLKPPVGGAAPHGPVAKQRLVVINSRSSGRRVSAPPLSTTVHLVTRIQKWKIGTLGGGAYRLNQQRVHSGVTAQGGAEIVRRNSAMKMRNSGEVVRGGDKLLRIHTGDGKPSVNSQLSRSREKLPKIVDKVSILAPPWKNNDLILFGLKKQDDSVCVF